MPTVKELPVKTSTFTDSPSYHALKHLSQHPYDLTRPGALNVERIDKYKGMACGYELNYASERIDDQVMHHLKELAKERDVIQKMHQMQSGEVMNVIHGYDSDNRPVLHTALRDQFDHQYEEPVAKTARLKARQQLDALKKFSDQLDKEPNLQHLVFIAIGGSELGPKANNEALSYLRKDNRTVHYVSNIDPDSSAAVLKNLPLNKTLVAVASKSGSTIETRTNELLFRDAYKKEGLDPNKYFIAVTGEGSPLDDLKNYRAVFSMWDWVGGRFSSTSTAGGVPIVFQNGFEVFNEFLRGAHAMDQAALTNDIQTNLPLLGALLGVWNRNFLGSPTEAIIPYSHALRSFCDHLQQLDMESNGKRVDQYGNRVNFETGPIVWGRTGTDAQHSFFQLLHQGTTRIPIEFIGFAESQYERDLSIDGTNSQQKLLANMVAQSISLATGQSNKNPNKEFPGNTPSHMLIAKKLTPFQLGALLSYHEHLTAFQGFIWGINSFDQEGVQLGKVLAMELIELQKKTPSKKINNPVGEALLRHISKI